MVDDALIEKIRKLIEVGRRGGTEAEMVAAIERAHAILAKHGLDLADINCGAEPEKADRRILEATRTQIWRHMLWQSIGELYFCQVFRNSSLRNYGHSHINIIGRPSNIAVVENLAPYVIDVALRLSQVGDHGAAYRKSFVWGFTYRVCGRINRMVEEARASAPSEEMSTALVVADLYKATEAENDIVMGKKPKVLKNEPKLKSRSGYIAGTAAGEKVALRSNGIEGGSTAPIALLDR